MARPLLFLLTLVVIIVPSAWCRQPDAPYFPKLPSPELLIVAKIFGADGIKLSNGTTGQSELIMLESMGGLLLRNGSKIGFYVEANIDASMVLANLVATRPVRTEMATGTAWDVLTRLGGPESYVIYNSLKNSESTDCARMAASKYGAVMVDASLVDVANSRGMKVAFDCSDKNDTWILENWAPTWPVRNLAVEQTNSNSPKGDIAAMNDVAVAFGTLAFWPNVFELREKLLAVMEPQGVILGWGHFPEMQMVPSVSAHDILYVACEWSRNMAVLSTFKDSTKFPLRQGGRRAQPPADPAKHYVAFMFTDGDNVEWLDGEHPGYEFYSSPYWWGSNARGKVAVGYGIGPDQRDLGQTVVENLYATASNTPGAEDFFIAMEPVGYTYLANMSATARKENGMRNAEYMRDLDLDILSVVTYPELLKDPEKYYAPYFDNDQVTSIFASLGAADGGEILWVDTPGREAKPVIYVRCALWGKPSKDVADITSELNKQVPNIKSSLGYSLVTVSVWHPYGVGDILSLTKQLGSHVEVVSPQRLSELVRANVARPDAANLIV